MTLDEMKQSWEIDCVIDEMNLGEAAAKNPSLHSKYLNEIMTVKLKLTKTQHEIATLKALKGRYFRGELTSVELKELGWEQWQYRTLKSDIADLIEADKDFQVLVAREQYIKTIIYFLESVISEIRNRNFSIRAAVDWAKFRAGM